MVSTARTSGAAKAVEGASAAASQDFLYDDHGADGSLRDLNDGRTGGNTFSMPNGT